MNGGSFSSFLHNLLSRPINLHRDSPGEEQNLLARVQIYRNQSDRQNERWLCAGTEIDFASGLTDSWSFTQISISHATQTLRCAIKNISQSLLSDEVAGTHFQPQRLCRKERSGNRKCAVAASDTRHLSGQHSPPENSPSARRAGPPPFNCNA